MTVEISAMYHPGRFFPLRVAGTYMAPSWGRSTPRAPKRSFQHLQEKMRKYTFFPTEPHHILHERSCNHFQCFPQTLEPKALKTPANLRSTWFSNRFSNYFGVPLGLWLPGATVGQYIPLREPRRPKPQNRLPRFVEGLWRLLLYGSCK